MVIPSHTFYSDISVHKKKGGKRRLESICWLHPVLFSHVQTRSDRRIGPVLITMLKTTKHIYSGGSPLIPGAHIFANKLKIVCEIMKENGSFYVHPEYTRPFKNVFKTIKFIHSGGSACKPGACNLLDSFCHLFHCSSHPRIQLKILSSFFFCLIFPALLPSVFLFLVELFPSVIIIISTLQTNIRCDTLKLLYI